MLSIFFSLLSYATVKILTVKNLGFKVYKYKYVFETAKSNWGAGYKALGVRTNNVQEKETKKQEQPQNRGIHLFTSYQVPVTRFQLSLVDNYGLIDQRPFTIHCPAPADVRIVLCNIR